MVNRLIGEKLKNSNSGELMATLTQDSSKGRGKAATNIQEKGSKFHDSREKRPKAFALCLRQKLSFKIRKCEGSCGMKMCSLKELFFVHTYRNTTCTDKVTIKEKVEYGHCIFILMRNV